VNGRNDIHLSAEQIQALLEGDLPRDRRERHLLEEHLASCARCSAEVDAWRVLFADLSELAARPLPRPSPGFADRVMSGVRIPEPVSQPARGWWASLLPAKRRHLSGDILQDLADGLLSTRRAARAHAHLVSCASCTAELEAWRGVMAALDGMPRFSPRESFADRVVAALAPRARTETAVAHPARQPAQVAPWQRALVVARRTAVRVMPRTRRAWAALSGVAVTPAAIFGLVLWVVFSHPTLTPQALVSFAMWQISDLLAAGWNGLLATVLTLASTTGYDSVLQSFASLARTPLVLAGGALVYSAVAAFALRVLYKNLIAHRRYARVSSR
jgi:anti-sigma factor RsiW